MSLLSESKENVTEILPLRLPVSDSCTSMLHDSATPYSQIYLVENQVLHRNHQTPGSLNHEQCTKAILNIVFEPYRRLILGGISINWLGIHKLYRVILVIMSTYFAEYLPRLSAMTGLVIVMSCLTVLFRPFKDKRTNQAAIL